MSFINTTITEGGLPDSLAEVLAGNGWNTISQFMKVVYGANLSKPNVSSFTSGGASDYKLRLGKPVIDAESYLITENGHAVSLPVSVSDDGEALVVDLTGTNGRHFQVHSPNYTIGSRVKVYAARHHILENVSGMLYGIAIAGWYEKILEVPPFTVINEEGVVELRNASFIDDILSRFSESYADRSTVYVYQLDQFLPPVMTNSTLPWQDVADEELLRMALDCEVWAAEWSASTTDPRYTVTTMYPNNKQSPIVTSRLRLPQIEEKYDVAINSIVQRTNWWMDSAVRVKGLVDSRTAMLILTADTTPMWEGNTVPSIPLYMGDFDKYDSANNGTNMEETVRRSFRFDGKSGGSTGATITTTFPIVEEGSFVDVYLVGDFSPGDYNDEWAWLTVDGQQMWKMSTGEQVMELPTSKTDPLVKKFTLNLPNIQGKTSFSFTYNVSTDVDASRVWLDFTVHTKGKPGLACLFAGTAFTSKSHTDTLTADQAISASRGFDPTNAAKGNFQATTQPYLKNYMNHPSNGVDSIMVKQTKFGALYQAYYLSWEQAPGAMPPDFADDDSPGYRYPRAWQQPENAEYDYAFNPSRYSDKVHSSKAYLVHPELGVHGSLRGVILMPPLSILDGDELREKVGCDMPVLYHYHLAEGISPLTKRPSTQYRPAGLGIRVTPFSDQ